MQMNAVFVFGKQYKSLNFPYILALIIENTPSSSQATSFKRLADYVKSKNGITIKQTDIDVFSSYYDIHFKEHGASIIEACQDVDYDFLLRM